MSQEDVQIARRAAAALADGNFETWLSPHDVDCEFRPLIIRAEGNEPYRGHQGCRAFWDDIHGAFADWCPQVEGARDCGDAAVLTIRLQGRGRDSGLPIDQRVWQAFRARGGKAVWWRIYPSGPQALEAVGLRESE